MNLRSEACTWLDIGVRGAGRGVIRFWRPLILTLAVAILNASVLAGLIRQWYYDADYSHGLSRPQLRMATGKILYRGTIGMTRTTRFRVLQIGKFYSPHVGGMESHLCALCGELQKSMDVEVLVSGDNRVTTETVEGGVKVVRVGTLCELASAPICPGMVRRIRDANADLVHLHLPNPFAIMAYLASGLKGHLVVTYHSDVVRQKLLGRAFQPILFRALDRCAAVIVASDKYVETSPVLSAYRERCCVIPHGIPVGQFQRCNPAEVTRIRDRYGPRIAITVGRLVYYKGLEHLIEAMGKVRGRLLIVGDGPLRAKLEHQVQTQGLCDRIVFLGKIEDVVPYYHAADLFVLASVARSEAFGVVQLEAMACGKPVVNTSLPSGVPFVSLDGITGITVPSASPEALAKAINLLLDDPIRRTQYGNTARRRVEAEFNLELMTRRTLQLYQRVMQFPNRLQGRMRADFDLDSGMEDRALANTAWPGAAD